MKASKLLCALSSENRVIMLGGRDTNKIRLIGSSVAKYVPSDESLSSVAFSLNEGDEGFIAVIVVVKTGKNEEHFSFFLPVKCSDGVSNVDLEYPWIPPDPDRLGVINYSGLTTEIDGIVYTSNPWGNKEDKRYVKDHNLICKYLNGEVDADAIRNAAEASKEDKAEKEVRDLKNRINELERLNRECSREISDLKETVAEKEKLLAEKEKALMKSYQHNDKVYKRLDAALRVIEAVENQWFSRPSLRRALQTFSDVVIATSLE